MAKGNVLYDSHEIYDDRFFLEYKKELEESNGEEYSDDTVYELFNENLNWAFTDLVESMMNCRTGQILAIADLGFWNGRKNGFLVCNRMEDVFSALSDYDRVQLYVEGGDLKASLGHHDGTHYLTFREIREGVNIENLTDKIYANEKYSRAYLNSYTKTLVPTLKECCVI